MKEINIFREVQFLRTIINIFNRLLFLSIIFVLQSRFFFILANNNLNKYRLCKICDFCQSFFSP